jgi:hypothetical protein
MGKHVYNFQIRVLICQEDREVCAHALEMDLLGYGRTEEAAIEDLCNLIDCQLTFARAKNDDSLLLFPAEKPFFKRWEAAHAAALRNEVLQDKPVAITVKAVCIALDDRLSNLSKKRFEPVELSRA